MRMRSAQRRASSAVGAEHWITARMAAVAFGCVWIVTLPMEFSIRKLWPAASVTVRLNSRRTSSRACAVKTQQQTPPQIRARLITVRIFHPLPQGVLLLAIQRGELALQINVVTVAIDILLQI